MEINWYYEIYAIISAFGELHVQRIANCSSAACFSAFMGIMGKLRISDVKTDTKSCTCTVLFISRLDFCHFVTDIPTGFRHIYGGNLRTF